MKTSTAMLIGQRFINLATILVMVLSLFSGGLRPVQAAGPDAGVLIDVTTNMAYAYNWDNGTEVTIRFDSPANGPGWDYSQTVTASSGSCGWCQFRFEVDPAVFQINPGQGVQITDGVTTKEFMISDVVVTAVDSSVNTIAGTASAGSVVNLKPYYFILEGTAERNVTAGGDGNWVADFSHVGVGSEEQELFAFKPGAGFFWLEQYVDIDMSLGIKYQMGLGPRIQVLPSQHRVETYGWPYGSTVTLTINDPGTPANPDIKLDSGVSSEFYGCKCYFH